MKHTNTLLFSLALLLSGALYATENEQQELSPEEFNKIIDEVSEKADFVEFTVRIYKDKNQFEQNAWNKIVSDSVEFIADAQRSTDRSFFLRLPELLKDSYALCGDATGIHGEIRAFFGENKEQDIPTIENDQQ